MKKNEISSPLFNFFTRSMILAFVFTITYHFTIGITLSKIDKIMDQVIWARGKVELIDKKMIQKVFHRWPSKIHLSKDEEERLRSDTKDLMIKLAPVIDELYLYKPKLK